MKTNRSILLTAFALLSTLTFGQVNFSGSWILNESKSKFSDSRFRMASNKLTITQDASAFSIERTFVTRDGEERKTTEKYTLDGRESLNPMFNSQKKSVAIWSSDKKVLTVSSSMTFEFNGETSELKSVENYSLSEDGKSMTIDTQSTSSRGERKYTAVYDKQ